jgi:hypothetical protein
MFIPTLYIFFLPLYDVCADFLNILQMDISKTVSSSLQRRRKSRILTAHTSPVRNSQNAKYGELRSGDGDVLSTGFDRPLLIKRSFY